MNKHRIQALLDEGYNAFHINEILECHYGSTKIRNLVHVAQDEFYKHSENYKFLHRDRHKNDIKQLLNKVKFVEASGSTPFSCAKAGEETDYDTYVLSANVWVPSARKLSLSL